MKHLLSASLWLGSAVLALCLAAAIAFGLWMHHPQSFKHALTLAQYALQTGSDSPSPLRFEGATGSLANGGHADQLEWQAAGTWVQITGLDIQLAPRAWIELFRQTLELKLVSASKVRVQHTQNADETPRPPNWALPYFQDVDIPLQIGHLEWDAGFQTRANGLNLRYQYGQPQGASGIQHRVNLESLTLANGQYQGEAQLDALQPWALRAELNGTVRADTRFSSSSRRVTLQALGSAHGVFGPDSSEVILEASLKPNARSLFATAPELQAKAVVHPWADMPLHEASFVVKRVDASALWPDAPRTLVSGHGSAGWSAAGSTATKRAWRLSSEFTNGKAGAWSQDALPVERLQLELTWQGQRWELNQFNASALGGRVQAQGAWTIQPASAESSTPWWRRLQDWEGHWNSTGLQPQMLDHTLRLPTLDLKTNAVNSPTKGHTSFNLQAHTSNRAGVANPELAVEMSGSWSPKNWRVAQLKLRHGEGLLEAAGGAESATGRFDVDVNLTLPGLRAHTQLEGDDTTAGEWTVSAFELPALQRWAQQFWAQWAPALAPWGAPQQPTWWLQTPWEGALEWQGQWVNAPVDLWKGQSQPPSGFQWSSRASLPHLKYRAPANALGGSLDKVNLTLSGQGDQVAITHDGTASWGPWTLGQALNATVQLRPTPMGWAASSTLQNWRINLDHQSRALRFQVSNPQPLRVQWQPPSASHPQGTLTLQPGQLQVVAAKTAAQPKVTATVSANPALLQWDSLQWDNNRWRSSGKATGWALSWVNAWLATEHAPRGPITESGLSGDLLLQAQWDVAAPEAKLQIRRESGDLVWATAVPTERVAAGLQETSVDLALNSAGEVTAQLRWLSDNAGQLVADAFTRLPLEGNDDAPLSGQLRLDLPKVGLWSRLAPTGWRMNGSLQAQVQLGGTVLNPAWYGNLQMRNLALRSLLDGLEFSDGQLNATLSGQHLTLDDLKIRGAGGSSGGWLTGQGEVKWQKGQTMPTMNLTLEAQALRLLARADRRLTLSGQLQARLQDEQLQVSGRMTADQALFLLPDESTPSLGDDVKILGKTGSAAASRGGVPTTVKVAIDLGDNFQVRGQGLSTYLQGQVDLSTKPGQTGTNPQLLGQIRTIRGTYRAYGQTLEIEEGTVRFNGPYDNPALEILAIRPHPTQRVGVQITGNARQPVVRLYAEPDLPDVEKLAWLILGRPATGGGAEAVVLQQAAWALLSGRGKQSDGNIVRALGFDEFTVMGQTVDANGNTNAAAITLGKRISNQLYLSYARSLAGATGTLSIFYDISQRWTLRGQAGDESGMDLIFTHKFD